VPNTSLDLELVAFDVAGTTLSVTDEVPAAFRYAFSTVDLGVSDVQVRAVRGVSKRRAVEQLLTTLDPGRDKDDVAHTRDAVFASFKERLLESYGSADVRPIAGAEETFAWLRDRKVAVALTTGFDRDLIQLLLARVGWTHTLDAVVGDTTADLQAAYRAGVGYAVGVLSGAHTEEMLREAPHDAIIRSVAELPAVLLATREVE
jgi:phosphoglycolate phosphatase-like HAD superfamily hydrolase